MRGNRDAAGRDIDWVGPIPAYAGEPAGRSRMATLQTAYPRVCGGTSVLTSEVALLKGLSPRMRGNPILDSPSTLEPGPIPAYAGEPHSGSWSGRQLGAYPRVCGGTGAQALKGFHDQGLSPRMRGNPR